MSTLYIVMTAIGVLTSLYSTMWYEREKNGKIDKKAEKPLDKWKKVW